MTNKNFMHVVKLICETTSTDCRSLNKAELARELMDMANIPSNATIEEIPPDWDNQVSICFTVPNDNNYYSLYAGHWLDDTKRMMLCIIGKQVHSGTKTFFDFFTEEKEVSLDYFVKNQNEKQEEQEIETETTSFYITYEDGREKRIAMRKAYRQYMTMVDSNQKEQGTTFTSWLSEMIEMQIFIPIK